VLERMKAELCYCGVLRGSVVSSLCTIAHPLHTRFNNIIGPLALKRQCDWTLGAPPQDTPHKTFALPDGHTISVNGHADDGRPPRLCLRALSSLTT
jgi:hypothetical protein